MEFREKSTRSLFNTEWTEATALSNGGVNIADWEEAHSVWWICCIKGGDGYQLLSARDMLSAWFSGLAYKRTDVTGQAALLRMLASHVSHVTEFGVRNGRSTTYARG